MSGNASHFFYCLKLAQRTEGRPCSAFWQLRVIQIAADLLNPNY